MTIEQDIQAKGLTAPRITPADIEGDIIASYYFTAAHGAYGAANERTMDNGGCIYVEDSKPLHPSISLLTFCVLVLRNGFTVTGESACVSPENFDAEIGRKIARQNAVQKIWPLMGYQLRTELSRPVLTEADAAADVAGTTRPDHPTI